MTPSDPAYGCLMTLGRSGSLHIWPSQGNLRKFPGLSMASTSGAVLVFKRTDRDLELALRLGAR